MKLGPYLLGPNDTKENGIYQGDCRELSLAIPDESIDLVFTDPVYQNIDDYRWLAETGARALKPDSACLVWVATPHLHEVLDVMCPSLDYAWLLYLQKYGPCYPGKPGICVITLCLWLEKGKSRTYRKMADWFGGKNALNVLPEAKNVHRWSKPQNVIAKWIDSFTRTDGVILDLFCGGGTVPAVCKMLGRKYLAFEIEPDTCQLARERVRNTQPPLFVQQEKQLGLMET